MNLKCHVHGHAFVDENGPRCLALDMSWKTHVKPRRNGPYLRGNLNHLQLCACSHSGMGKLQFSCKLTHASMPPPKTWLLQSRVSWGATVQEGECCTNMNQIKCCASAIQVYLSITDSSEFKMQLHAGALETHSHASIPCKHCSSHELCPHVAKLQFGLRSAIKWPLCSTSANENQKVHYP